MNLRTRTILLLGATLLGSWVVLYLLSSASLLNSFSRLDERETRQNAERVRLALQMESDQLAATLIDWANWDDTYAFVGGDLPGYVESNLTDEAISNLRLNVMVFLDTAGHVVYGKGFDLQAGAEASLSSELLARLAPGGTLRPLEEQDLTIHGLLALPEGPMIIAFKPILNSLAEGPSRGTLVLGQYLTGPALAHLSQTTHVTFSLQPIDSFLASADSREAGAVAQLQPDAVFVQPVDAHVLAGYLLVGDYLGRPTWLLRVEKARDIYRQGQVAVQALLVQLVIIGLVFSGATLLLLEGTVLARLARLSAGVSRIGTHGDISARVTVEGQDEIARLAKAINQTVEKLELSNSLLKTTLESTDAGILTLDMAGQPAIANQQFFTLWGVTQEFLKTPGEECFKLLAARTVQPARSVERFGYWAAHPSETGTDEFDLTNGRTLECYTLPELIGGPEGKIVGRIWNCRDVTPRKQAQAALNRQMGELITVRDIALVGSEANSQDALVELSTKIIGSNLFPTETINVGLVDPATGQLQVFTSHYVRGDIAGCTLQPGQGIAGRAVATGQIQIVPDVSQDPAYVQINPDTRSEICVPLKTGSQVLGFLNVESTRLAAFGLADERLLSIVAGQLTTALEKVHMSAEVQRLAITDSLTGLYNRHYFFGAAQLELDHARRYGHPISAIMLDLDHFKHINDTYGHARGDVVLKAVAAYCRKSLRETDLLGRYGGEEFSVVLTETALDGAQEVAERLRDGIAGLSLDGAQGQSIKVTASLGIASFSEGLPTLDKLFDCADQALYHAKNGGRNRVRVWTASGSTSSMG